VSRIAVVFGTRPEMIKLSPLIAALGDRALVVHTGQHFDDMMSETFLDQLGIGRPDVHLAVGGLTRGAQIGTATIALEALFLQERPDAVVVQGDTNSGLAGALAANSAGIPLVHLEAGLRSHDRAMPEEHNRVVIDALSDLCLAPHQSNAELLLAEGVTPDRIRVTGSTLRAALQSVIPLPADRERVVRGLGVPVDRFVLATIHRAENADSEANLRTILTQLANIELPVLLPLHPRTKARVAEFGFANLLAQLVAVEPLGYREFIAAASACALLVSDSGGVQEEATIVKRPVVIIRNSTERPEILGTFAHLVAVSGNISGIVNQLLREIASVHEVLAQVPYPYGDDAVGECIRAIDGLVTASPVR
jgi:UDP-N-acetylglucosamine 2-epimerase (non-hydrolysing)